MSDYTKDIKQSLIDGGLMAIGICGLAWIGSKIGISKPSLSMGFENMAKITGYAAIADKGIDYLKKNKYIPSE